MSLEYNCHCSVMSASMGRGKPLGVSGVAHRRHVRRDSSGERGLVRTQGRGSVGGEAERVDACEQLCGEDAL